MLIEKRKLWRVTIAYAINRHIDYSQDLAIFIFKYGFVMSREIFIILSIGREKLIFEYTKCFFNFLIQAFVMQYNINLSLPIDKIIEISQLITNQSYFTVIYI